METNSSASGRHIFCPNCGQKLIVPHVDMPSATANVLRDPPANYSILSHGAVTKRLAEIDWFQFEKLMAMVYRAHGFRVERKGGAKADGGIDLIIEKNGAKTAVQCKHWKSWKVGVRNVRELKGAMTISEISQGILVTIRGYSEEARSLAEQQGILLLDTGELLDLINNAGLLSNEQFVHTLNDDTKYCPKCETRLVLRTAEKGMNRGNKFWGCPRYPKCRYLVNV
jgi:restriction system protein